MITRTIDHFVNNGALSVFLFHSVFINKKELESGLLDPQQKITLQEIEIFVDYFLNMGYEFVDADTVSRGLKSGKKYILMTFDDGYFNNTRVLPLLNKYRVPGTFYIASDFVKEQKSFWWDSVYREMKKGGASGLEISQMQTRLKKYKHDKIEKEIIKTFGPKALRPISDLDRPMKPLELKKFSQQKFVCLGNHTAGHAILTNYTILEAKSQILECQKSLLRMTGKSVSSIAYPNGNFNEMVIRATREAGINLGITVEEKKNSVSKLEYLKINRFILWGGRNLRRQFLGFQFDLWRQGNRMLRKYI